VGRHLFFLGAAALLAAGIAIAFFVRFEPPAPDPGIPLTLADDRAARISDVQYDATFHVPADRTTPVTGHVTVAFTLGDPSAPVAFDFAQTDDHLLALGANGRVLDPRIQNEHVVIPGRALVAGENVIEMEFVAGDEALNRQDEFLYTLFVPAKASLAMPVFDQPNLKARWRLTVDIPPGWTAIANGRETGRLTADDRLSLIFDETEPIPTYLVAFAAGRFEVESAERDGRVFRMFHREPDAAKVARNRDAVFDLHAGALTWLEEYTGIPYPFDKFEFILIPSFQFGGMEHPGAVFYRANSLLLDESATQSQMLSRANLISHETSHMWFGDLVTIRWFNDVWMKEVFANFMAAKIVNPSFPEVNHDLRFLLQNYPAAYGVDRTDGANPIRQDLENLNEVGSLYGAIIYQKAPIVMRQLELLMGEDAFRDGLREYLSAHAFGNATWPDLVAVLDARSSEDLVAWSHAWVDEPGRPTIRIGLETSFGTIGRLSFRQEDPRGRGLVWPERLQVALGWANRTETFDDVRLDEFETVLVEADGLPEPEWILPVGGGLGYGFFDLDDTTLEYLTRSLHRIPDPLTRGSALVALWEAMLEGRVPPARVLETLLAALPRETDELLTQAMLDYLQTAFWRFTGADERARIASRVDSTVRSGLSQAGSTSAKAAWFNALRALATSRSTVQWLEDVWRGDAAVGGLPLSENDLTGLAMDLAVRNVESADEILQMQLGRIDNPDRWERFAFVMPALSSDGAIRDAFFESLADVENRDREAWVLDAARYLHHPLRASTSRKYILPALDLVREIQQTGDIFFPKRWADVSLSGYQSVQTAAEVREFINGLPEDYPPRLRWVLLSSADPLFRAARLLNR
jgi:aminopeptidase N